MAVQIEFVRSGGFAGISLSTSVDTSTLPAAEAQRLEDLVEQADFFSLPRRPAQPSRGADRFQYDITITRAGVRHEVTLGDDAVTPALQPLIQELTARAMRR